MKKLLSVAANIADDAWRSVSGRCREKIVFQWRGGKAGGLPGLADGEISVAVSGCGVKAGNLSCRRGLAIAEFFRRAIRAC
ncbi:hypothetical protein NB636_05275 [Oxalobacter aliiformigenes]|uniref:hypothetical protein n=1 Tax=Oxalobacter aliiformigenes TaxID=2946593 RepID=UPI0022B06FE3|nr:hypothetical protein [Oxalobacter aliiformigenes]MCZ4065891.1 hypothetical protein [Oxalobacter aliiformigenes]WAW00257.1 hypothetical protein NB636_05275 [Oxalobacter aliiformigenes]